MSKPHDETSPKTYKHTRSDGTNVRVSVPEDPKPEELLADAIRDNLSPHGVALIAAKCALRHGKPEPPIEREIAWFGEFLIDLLGTDEYERLCDELGL